jgi:hypothetical protein
MGLEMLAFLLGLYVRRSDPELPSGPLCVQFPLGIRIEHF